MGFAWGVWAVVCACGEERGDRMRACWVWRGCVGARACVWVRPGGLGMERVIVQALATWVLSNNARALRSRKLAGARWASDWAWVGWDARGARVLVRGWRTI